MPEAPRLLVLLDIDGTLMWRASAEHAASVFHAIQRVHGDLELQRVDAAGRTDRHIVRALLRGAGLTDAAIDAEMDVVLQLAASDYERRCPPDLSSTVLPGIAAMLAQLAQASWLQLGLVTGNLESVAHRKLTAGGIDVPLRPFVGAYGSDHEDRNVLVPLAQQRAAAMHGRTQPWPGESTVIVGDTPHDIACARAAGARVIAVATGAYEARQLQDADLVADSPGAVWVELQRLGAAPR